MKKLEILLRKLLLRLFIFFHSPKKPEGEPTFNRNSKILFIRLNRIGDALVTTPLLKEIKEQLGCKIYILADKKNHFIFERCPAIDKVIIYRKGSFAINDLITAKGIDTIVDLHDDVSTTVSLLVMKAKVQNKFGLKKSNYKIYTQTAERIDSSKHHIIERVMELGKLFGLKTESPKIKICYQPKPGSINFAEDVFSKINPDNKFTLGINITAGSDARYWGTENFRMLISLLNSYDINHIIFTTKEKLDEAKKNADEKFIYPVSEDFDIFAAGILKLSMLFTPDTSVVHIASINRIPVFGLYVKYKTEDMIWSPYNTDFDCIITEEPTLKNVTFEEVKNKFIPFLERHLNE